MNKTPELIRTPDGCYSVEGAGPELLGELLDTFQDEMRRAGWTAQDQLAPGIRAAEIRQQLAQAQLQVPDELVVFYGWHNGFLSVPDGLPMGSILPSVTLMSLERSLASYVTSGASPVVPRSFWHPGWLRLEEVRPGYMIECGPPELPPRLAYISEDNPFEGPRRRAALRSICTLATVWIDLIRQGASTWTGAYWQFDRTKVTEAQAMSGIVDPY